MNFMTEGIGTTISVNTVESDGFEAKNLLCQGEPWNNNSSGGPPPAPRGFLAESFVRPPVTLSIKFPLCIEVSHIVINPKLGKQITSAILIHTETSYRSWTKENNGPVSSHLVAKEFINSPIPNVIVFRNPRFVLRRPFSNLPLDHYSRYRNHEHIYNLKHPSFNANQRVVGMEITILRVAGSSVPALGGLQVWGQPCIRCGQDEVNKLYKQWSRILRKGDSFVSTQGHSTDSSDEGSPAAKRPKLSNSPTSTAVSVPEDFLDAITCEIMCQPIRLPCGLAVDARTLEKYYAEEARFGRLPNDPFTGLTFNDSFKPLPDASLKSRISSFLSQHPDEPSFADLPRTLGGSSSGGGVRSRSPPTNNNNNNTNTTGVYQLFRNPNYVPRVPNFNSVSTMKSGSSTVTNYFDLEDYGASDFPSFTYTTSPLHPNPRGKLSTPSSTLRGVGLGLGCEEQMNYELFKMLSEGQSYLTKSKPKRKLDRNCKDCGLVMNLTRGISSFYIGLCDHVILCKSCLSKTDKQTPKTCSVCGIEWRSKDCLRIFI